MPSYKQKNTIGIKSYLNELSSHVNENVRKYFYLEYNLIKCQKISKNTSFVTKENMIIY